MALIKCCGGVDSNALNKGSFLEMLPSTGTGTISSYVSGTSKSWTSQRSIVMAFRPRTSSGTIALTATGGTYMPVYCIKNNAVVQTLNSGSAVSTFSGTYPDCDLIIVPFTSSSDHNYTMTITDN